MSRSIPPRKCLLVFDFNGTLLSRVKKCVKSEDRLSSHPYYREHDHSTDFEWVFVRPFVGKLAKFLNLNQDFIEYAFWTSAFQVNADRLYKVIEPYGFYKPKFVWSQEKCQVIGLDGVEKPMIKKDLTLIWNEYKVEFDLANIILVDDSEYKAIVAENHLLLKEFDALDYGQDLKSNQDLLHLIDYLQNMIDSIFVDKQFNDCVTYISRNKYSTDQNHKTFDANEHDSD